MSGAPTASVDAARGLSSVNAVARLAADGPNVLPLPRPPSPVSHLLGQMTHLFALMLWVADRAVLRRVFVVLGPTEAVIEMAAFVATFLAAGWLPGEPFPGGTTLLAVSGAAFSAVVIGQAANAFACCSTTRWPGRLGWTSNRLLIGAVAAALMALAAFLYVPALADLLDQAPPTLAGFAVALLAAPAVLTADAIDKARRARRAR